MEGWIKEDDKFENECNECCMKCEEMGKCEDNCMINSFNIWCDICKHD